MLQHLRGMGFILCWYVDDILLLGETPSHVLNCLKYLLQLLTQLGIRVNFPKCNLTPCQSLPYLGQMLHLALRTIAPIPLKAQGCRWMARKLSSGNTIRPCNLASLAGKLLDLQKGAVNLVGLARLLMHHAGVLSRQGWYTVVSKNSPLRTLLLLTKEALQVLTHTQLPHPSMSCVTLTVDACQTGWGGVLSNQQGILQQTHQLFTPLERLNHITWKELQAITRALQAFWIVLPHPCFLTIQSDATTAVANFNKGSSKLHLNEPARALRTKLHQHLSCAQTVHLPGVANTLADRLSRMQGEASDLACHLPILHNVWKQLKVTPQVDMFASDHNHRLPRYWSWHPSPFAERVDAMRQDWNFSHNGLMHCNPPWPLILRVLRKVGLDKAKLVMCLPYWAEAPWWPLFLSLLQGRLLIHKGPLYLNQWGRLL